MTSKQSQFPDQTRKDVPEPLMTAALRRLQKGEIQPREWKQLVKTPNQANLVRFIESVSYAIAPSNPALRGRITSALIELHYLEENSQLIAEIAASWEPHPAEALKANETKPTPAS